MLGVDLDGVCGDYTAAFRRVVAAERGVDSATCPPSRSWDFEEWGLDEVGGFERLHRVAVLDHRMFRDMPVIDGCAEALWRLSDAGVWIRIITHRLVVNWGHAVAVADTVAWLDAHGIPYRDLCFLGHKPEVEADCYIDDAPHNVESLRAAGNDGDRVRPALQPRGRRAPGPNLGRGRGDRAGLHGRRRPSPCSPSSRLQPPPPASAAMSPRPGAGPGGAPAARG